MTEKDILKVYNREPENKIKAQTVGNICHSVLFKEVPRTKISVNSPEFDNDKCWHCQENLRIKADPDAIVWCERCYILQFKKFDGTYIQHNTIPAMKKLMQDYNEGKLKDIPLERVDTKFIQE